jgi:hypothetical protein
MCCTAFGEVEPCVVEVGDGVIEHNRARAVAEFPNTQANPHTSP